MSNYLEVVNNNNKVLVNDETMRIHITSVAKLSDYPQIASMEFSRGGMRNISESRLAGWFFKYEIPMATTDFFVAIKPTGNAADVNLGFVIDRVVSGSCYIGVYARWECGITSSNISNYIKDVYVYVFGNSPILSPNYGLEAYDISGNRVFSSNTILANIVGKYRRVSMFDGTGYPENEYPFTVASGWSSNYAFTMNNFEAHVAGGNGGFFAFWNVVYGVSAVNGQYTEVIFSNYYAPNQYSYFMTYALRSFTDMVFVDVSNIPLPN